MNNKGMEIYNLIKEKFKEIIDEKNIASDEIVIKSRGLSPEEAIGNTKRKDYPILTGKEVMLQATYKDSVGQAFSNAPRDFSGTLTEILDMDLENDLYARGVFIATINAVLRELGLIENTIHCKSEEPELCAKKYIEYMKEHHMGKKILIVGYQPSLIEYISKEFEVRVLDLDPKNIGMKENNVMVGHGIDDYEEFLDWSDVVLSTGSIFANGSMEYYVGIDKDVILFGTSCSGAAKLLGIKRFCPMSK